MKASKTRAFRERRSTDLRSASQRALRPLVKLLLDRGIGFPEMSEILRTIYFQVARDEFPLRQGKETDSRLSLLTGIHRRDIKRLREQGATPTAQAKRSRASAEVSIAARVVGLWTGAPEYLDGKGKPKPLQRFQRKGGGLSFEALVRQVNRDVRPRALLDEWLRRGAVTLDGEGRVCLNLDAFMSHKQIDEKAHYFAQNIHDHLATVVRNISGEGASRMERCVYYGELTPESIAALETLARDHGMKALQAVNRRALQLKKRDAARKGAKGRMNFGLYFYGSEPGSPAQPPRPKGRRGNG